MPYAFQPSPRCPKYFAIGGEFSATRDGRERETPPRAPSPITVDDIEVLSRRTYPSQGEVQEAVREVTEGKTSVTEHLGEQIPLETGDRGRV